MLYDPKWQKTKEPSLEGMIAWLETKDPSERYDYHCNDGLCLIQQYFVSLGREPNECFKSEHRASDSWYYKLTFANPQNPIAVSEPRTFGGALKRARAALITSQG